MVINQIFYLVLEKKRTFIMDIDATTPLDQCQNFSFVALEGSVIFHTRKNLYVYKYANEIIVLYLKKRVYKYK